MHPQETKSEFLLSHGIHRGQSISNLELKMFILTNFFLFQGHFLNYTNLSNVSSFLQEVFFSYIC